MFIKLFLNIVSINLLFVPVSYGQILDLYSDKKGDIECFDSLKDEIVKQEILYFVISGGLWGKRDSLIKEHLIKWPLLNSTDNSATFSCNKMFLKISASSFDSTRHKLTYADPKNPYLVLIDNKPFWGTDGALPRNKISSISYQLTNRTKELPACALENLFEPNFCNTKAGTISCPCGVFQSKDKRRLYIYMLNSDGAGGYEVTWVIEDNKYLRRIINYGF